MRSVPFCQLIEAFKGSLLVCSGNLNITQSPGWRNFFRLINVLIVQPWWRLVMDFLVFTVSVQDSRVCVSGNRQRSSTWLHLIVHCSIDSSHTIAIEFTNSKAFEVAVMCFASHCNCRFHEKFPLIFSNSYLKTLALSLQHSGQRQKARVGTGLLKAKWSTGTQWSI